MNSPAVVFMVEHVDRELDVANRIARDLKALHGISSAVLSVYFDAYRLISLRPKLLITPFATGAADWPISLMFKLCGTGIHYLSMSWEQLLSPVNLHYKQPRDEFVREFFNHIAWDTSFSDTLRTWGVTEGNIFITGNPAHQLLGELLPKSKVWRDKLAASHAIPATSAWLFCPMNYAWAFADDATVCSKINKGYPVQIAWEYRQYSRDCLAAFIQFITEFALSKPACQVVLRPHPSVSVEDYLDSFARQGMSVPRNIHLSKAYSIREWLIACDAVCSSWSTTALDALRIGKPSCLFTPLVRPKWLNVPWNDEILNVQNIDELSSLVNRGLCEPVSLNVGNPIAKIVDIIVEIIDREPDAGANIQFEPVSLSRQVKYLFDSMIRNLQTKVGLIDPALLADRFKPLFY